MSVCGEQDDRRATQDSLPQRTLIELDPNTPRLDSLTNASVALLHSFLFLLSLFFGSLYFLFISQGSRQNINLRCHWLLNPKY